MQQLSYRLATALCVLILTPAILPAQAGDVRRSKKIIASGCDQPDTHTLRENLAVMEELPFDGVVINAIGRSADGKPRDLRGAFCDEVWQREWYQNCIDDLKACPFQHFTDNFFVLGANPGNVDWFDDAGWKNIVEHWRIAAWLAKQAGVKGLLFDPEPYQPPFAMFRYSAQPPQRSFAEYSDKVRQRGREMMQAIAAEYPDMTLFCYFMQSINMPAAAYADPRIALEQRSYGLYSSFMDGWLDAIPPTLTLVDGCENGSYLYNAQREFLAANLWMKGDCQALVSPENRAKYRAQVQTSFGFYLDAYWHLKDSEWGAWYIDGLGGSRAARLQANAATGLRVADEYIWLWGEKFRWWPMANGATPKRWPEVLPGCDEMLRLARDPQGVGRQRIAAARQTGTLKNLLVNGDFAAETVTLADGSEAKYAEGGPPAGWEQRLLNGKKGSFAWDRPQKAARLADVQEGDLRQTVAVEPEQFYAVRGLCRQQGRGDALIRIRWRTADGQWLHKEQDCFLCPIEPVNGGKEAFRVVQVPEKVTRMVVTLWVRGQGSADDVTWFDDLEVFRVP